MSMRFLVLASFVVVLVGVSLGCGATPDPGDRADSELSEGTDGSEASDGSGGSRPPQSTLSYGGETVSGALGTYCWSSDSGAICADAVGIPVNEEALTVPAGSTLTFTYGGKKLDSLSVSADRIGQGNHLERMGNVSVLVPDEGSKGYQEIRLQSSRSGNRARVAAELPAGKYIVAVFVKVPQGDALYGFRVVVE
jgi:hypothetical protein